MENSKSYSSSECVLFLRIFNKRFHYQTGTCKIDFSPVLLRPARRIQSWSILGGALCDVIRGKIAERACIHYVRGEATLW